jgi:SAM-dependent MidA family methyltransferase
LIPQLARPLSSALRSQAHPVTLDFPAPSPEALAHSAALCARVREAAAANAGWLSFADYMNLALYAPGLGYYSAGARKFGAAGDFVTAPEISPLFAQCVASQCAQVLESLGGGSIIEPGAGTGIMAADILLELERLDVLPEQYLILEPSADLRARQAETVARRIPHLQQRITWLDRSPEQPLRGVMVANEVLDALPVNRFTIRAGEVHELGVICAGNAFVYATRPASTELAGAVTAIAKALQTEMPEGFTSELCLQLPAWLRTASGWLKEGVALIFDYGFPRREYYLPERSSGTLRCYYRHRAHENPFLWTGLQDITAWVDFSWLAESALAAGFSLSGYTTQANFLLASGIEQRVPAMTADAQTHVAMAAGLRQLLLPGEMGEAVKVIALGRGGADAPAAMFGRDLRSRL